MHKSLIITITTLLIACGGGSDTGADTEAIGQASYRDAETESDGSPREPAPVDRAFTVSIEIEGSATLSGVDPTCLDGAAGQFEGLFRGTAALDDGVYVAGFAAAAAELSTPGGCDIPDLEIAALARVVVRGELEASTSSCESYCSAKARNHAEATCEGTGDQASCRGSAEGEYQGSCTTTCTRTDHVIVAEAELSAAARAELAASSISGAGLGTFDADLTFERIEDRDGNSVDEAP